MNCRYFYELSHASLILTTQFILQGQFVNMQSDRLYNKFFFVRTKRYFMIQLYIYFGCNLNEQYSLLIFDVHHRIFRLNFLSRFIQFHFILIFTYIYMKTAEKKIWQCLLFKLFDTVFIKLELRSVLKVGQKISFEIILLIKQKIDPQVQLYNNVKKEMIRILRKLSESVTFLLNVLFFVLVKC